MVSRYALIIPLALLLDWILGDPPNKFHPIAWMGSLISFAMRFHPWEKPAWEFTFGLALTLAGMALTFAIDAGLQTTGSNLPFWSGVILQAVALKLTVSLRGLWRAFGEVQSALEANDLPEYVRLSTRLPDENARLLAALEKEFA